MLNPRFEGFESPLAQGDTLIVPRSFFERVVVGEPVSTVRVVAFILTRSLQGQDEVEASYTDFVRELRLCRQAVQEGLARALEAGYIRQVQSGSNAHLKSRYAICWAKPDYNLQNNSNRSNFETDDKYHAETENTAPSFASPPSPPLKYRAEKHTTAPGHIPYQSGKLSGKKRDSKSHSNSFIFNQEQNQEIELETFLESKPVYLPNYPPANPPTRTSFTENPIGASIPDTTLVFPAISSYLSNLNRDFSRELGDLAHTNSNRTQLFKLWRQSNLSEKEFATLMYKARELTRRYAVRRAGEKEPAPGEVRNRMPYFFAVLRNLLDPLATGSGGKGDYGYAPPGTYHKQPNSPYKGGPASIPIQSGYALADLARTEEESWRNFRGAEALRQQHRLQALATTATTVDSEFNSLSGPLQPEVERVQKSS